ncbi:MAG TPA: carboxypeptidase regulatory-like domain-containing protein [Pyrinomonadaceae bacterium]|nr:carboxypeptidase regulatory-like domain-containing protein [Pyrinomonadaceae bacterium]
MSAGLLRIHVFGLAVCVGLLLAAASPTRAQSTASIEGLVIDQQRAVVSGVKITLADVAIGVERETTSDEDGRYQFTALPVGDYTIGASATGFKKQIIENLRIEVGRRITQDFELEIGNVSEQVTISSQNELIERSSTSVGHVIDRRMVQEVPLNGRYFLDLGLLLPGSVTPPQGAFSASPMRGLGSLAIITAGNREETVNYMINGITLNNLTFSSISFQPSISTIQEFKADNSTFSAEYGESSGAVVNIATRSGANDFHGELFEFFRNDVLDARNFFELTSAEPTPFKRNQFGGNLGGPIVRDKLFFYASYEGLRQRQGLDLNSLVLSDAQRAGTNDPVIASLIALIPRANLIDSSGQSRFVSSASAPVTVDQWSVDINYNLGNNDRIHGYYAVQDSELSEPTRTGNTIPGFGNVSRALRQIFTLNETHTFSPTLVNELRLGFNRFSSTSTPLAQLNPADLGIRNGVNQPIGISQINIAGGSLNFGGPANQPSGRGDTTFVAATTMSWLRGKHSLKFGGEFRQFLNNNFRQTTGSFNFPSVAAFLAGTANSFSITLGNQSSSVAQPALGFFAEDGYKIHPTLTLELGLRYEWNMTPTERYERFIVFDPRSASLLRVGTDLDKVYRENNKNIQPRIGFAWSFPNNDTVIRGAYGIYVDQPMTSIVTGLSGNPPLAVPLTFSGAIRLNEAIDVAGPAGLAPQSIDRDFENAYMQSWNLNVQREFLKTAVMVGYLGSKGTHLITRRNLNQPIDGVRPFPALSASSPILPNTPLGNVTEVGSSGVSSYNALWVTATRRLTKGCQFDASYTWSKSIDYTSFSTGGIVVQDSFDLPEERGLSDFDARHRFVLSSIYELPFDGNELTRGWQLGVIVQSQSGNPFNVVTSNSTVTGLANTLRPNVDGPVEIIGEVEQWFDTTAFDAVPRFGNLGRNVIIGPTFNNIDFSVMKTTNLGERVRVQFRAEVFDLFNHANFGRPGNTVGTPSFGRITSTRFPTGESGSSRQIQFALKLIY